MFCDFMKVLEGTWAALVFIPVLMLLIYIYLTHTNTLDLLDLFFIAVLTLLIHVYLSLTCARALAHTHTQILRHYSIWRPMLDYPSKYFSSNICNVSIHHNFSLSKSCAIRFIDNKVLVQMSDGENFCHFNVRKTCIVLLMYI